MYGKRQAAPENAATQVTAEQALMADPRLSQSVLDSVPANIFVADLDLKLVYLNPRAVATLAGLQGQVQRTFGKRADQLVGVSVPKFHRDPGKIDQLLRTRHTLPVEAELEFGDLTLGANINQLRDPEDKLVGYVIAWADITDKIKIARRAERLAARLDETQEVSSALKAVAGATEEMVSAASDIARTANEATVVVGNAVTSVEAANRTMVELGEASEKINDIVKTITLVADQTNLLALNATIEAARAGEAGKGFAVVAGEVKELSKQTKSATERINEMIAQVQALSGAAIQAIAGISAIVEDVSRTQHSIAAAVEQQTASTTDVSANLSRAADRAESIASFVASNRDD
jgi:PAS domain-containing protein